MTFLRKITFPRPRRFRGMLALLASSVMTMGVLTMADELVLYDFSKPVPPELLEMRQTSTRLTEEGALEIVFSPVRLGRASPSKRRMANGPAPLSAHWSDIRNTGERQVVSLDNPGADGNKHCLQRC